LSEHRARRGVVVFQIAGMADCGEEVMIWKKLHVRWVDMLLELAAGGELETRTGKLGRRPTTRDTRTYCNSTPFKS
jgi:hypothetical protein